MSSGQQDATGRSSLFELIGPQSTLQIPQVGGPGGSSLFDMLNQQIPGAVNINPLQGLAAGFVAGTLEPLTIIHPINEVHERMSQFYGDDLPEHGAYGLGYLAGTFLPGALAFKAANAIVRGAGGALKVFQAADKANDLNRTGKFTRGAIAGALYGAGTHAEDLNEEIAQILSMAALGGAGDVLIPAAFGAISSRFGRKENLAVRRALDPEATGVRTDIAPMDNPIVQHARAMQLTEDLDFLTMTVDQERFYQSLRDRGVVMPDQDATPSAMRRLNLQLGLESLNLDELVPGQLRIVPAPHNDADDIIRVIKRRAPELRAERMNLPGRGESVIAARGEGLDEKLLEQLREFGYVQGQHALWRGSKWFVQRPVKRGSGVFLTQPGRGDKQPVFAPWREVQFLDLVDDPGSPVRASELLPLSARFVDQFSLWPTEVGFNAAFREFSATEGLDTRHRRALLDRLTRAQRESLVDEDPDLGLVLETLDREIVNLRRQPLPDGSLDQLAAEKRLTYVQDLVDGEWKYSIRNAQGHTVSPLLRNTDTAEEWVRNYGVDSPDALADNIPIAGNPLADNTVPGAGQTSVPAHTAGEFSRFRLGIGRALTSELLPLAHFFAFAEDQLLKIGIADVRPYTRVFLPLQNAKVQFRRELADRAKQVERILKPVREDKFDAFTNMFEADPRKWNRLAVEAQLTEGELGAARELRTWYDDVWQRFVRDENIDVTSEDYIQNYFPHYRRKSDADAPNSIRAAFRESNKQVNAPTMSFISEMQRTGRMTKYETDPRVVSMQYLRSGLSKSLLKEPLDNAAEVINSIPTDNANAALLRQQLTKFFRLAHAGQPEAFVGANVATKNLLEMLGVNLDELTKDKLVNTLLTMNYGAFIGFRPGLALRNLTQTLITTYPVLGARWTGRGIRDTMLDRKELWDEMKAVGALLEHHVPQPGEDLLYQSVGAMTQEANVLAGFKRGVIKITDLGMRWFTQADDINRGVAYAGMKAKTLDAWARWGSRGEWDKFYRKSGLNYFGEATKREFRERLESAGTEEAAKFAGKLASDDTQWLYQLGAGPALFSHGVGRLVGQYGTWPSWYLSYLGRGAKNLQGVERGVWAARAMAVNWALPAVGAAMGLNLNRWTGLSSLSWMGGPAVDWFSDTADIVTGVSPSGEATVDRNVALSRLGLRDTGSGISLLPEALGGRIALKPATPQNPNPAFTTATELFGNITPGFLALKDLGVLGGEGVLQQKSLLDAVIVGLNLPRYTAGHEWPQVHAR